MSGKFGIHMGNSTICLSVVKEDDKIDIVASKFGDRSSYAVLAATASDPDDHDGDEVADDWLIGLPAKQGLVRNGTVTIVNNLQFLNDSLTEMEFEDRERVSSCKIQYRPKEYHLISEDWTRITTPHEVAVILLTNCHENASQAVKSSSDPDDQFSPRNLQCVVSVPLHFNENSRNNLAKAVREAGFDVIQLITEPAAALLAYDIGTGDDPVPETVMIYRCGGLTTDISIFDVIDGCYELVATKHLPETGGNRLTDAFSEYLATEFQAKYHLDPHESRRTMCKLRQHAETCKHILSTMSSAHIHIESLMDGIDWSVTISRARFEMIIGGELQLFTEPVDNLLRSVAPKTIDKVILCGGCMKVPKLQATICNRLPDTIVLNSIPADEVIATGAAKQASYVSMWDQVGEHVDWEMATLSQRIEITIQCESEVDRKQVVLWPSGTRLPISEAVSVKRTNLSDQLIVNCQQGDREPPERIIFNQNNLLDLDLIQMFVKCSLNSNTKLPEVSVILPEI